MRYLWCWLFHGDWKLMSDDDYPELDKWTCCVCGRQYDADL
jgi:hypothetical protein